MERLLSFARERAEAIDALISEITSGIRIDCGEGCAYCCYGVPLWVRMVELYHLFDALNRLPAKGRRKIATRLRNYEKEYSYLARIQGYLPESPLEDRVLDVERLGAICGLGMNEIPCPFLSEEKSCMVYEARPSMCRLTLFPDRRVCGKDWENPLAFIWKNEIAPFIERLREKFYPRWKMELDRLRRSYPDLDLSRLEREMVFLPKHFRFDPVRGAFRLRVPYSP